RIDCLGLHELSDDQRWLAWGDLSFLDKYVLQFVEKRFDQQAKTRDGRVLRMVYDGHSIRVPFAVELDGENRRKLDSCEGIIADLDGQNVLYYSDQYHLEMAWFVLTGN
ncbi:MAG: hypothetical protein ABSD88_17955, partial [Candidatus Korobacteraceae bacterium]